MTEVQQGPTPRVSFREVSALMTALTVLCSRLLPCISQILYQQKRIRGHIFVSIQL